MYGVVLWSDMVKKCAVIWCEDHRNLAYFNGDGELYHGTLGFDPGDLVEFDVREEGDMRFALNPSVVAQGHYQTLPDDLMNATAAPNGSDDSCACVTHGSTSCAHVVPFPDLADRAKHANANDRASDRANDRAPGRIAG